MDEFLGGLAARAELSGFSSSSEGGGAGGGSEKGELGAGEGKRRPGRPSRARTDGVPAWKRQATAGGAIPVLTLSDSGSPGDSGDVQEVPGPDGSRAPPPGVKGVFDIELPPLAAPAPGGVPGLETLALQKTRQEQQERLKALMETPQEEEIEVEVNIEVSTSGDGEDDPSASGGGAGASQPPPGAGLAQDEAGAGIIVLKVQSSKGMEKFKVKAEEGLGRLFEHYEKNFCEGLGPSKFMLDGEKLGPNDTPRDLDLEDGDIIEAR